MKLDYGKRYILSDGRSTGPLKINGKRAINYPYYDPETGLEFDKGGGVFGAFQKGIRIIERIYSNPESAPVSVERYASGTAEMNVSYVTMTAHEYDRLKKIESTFKEIFELAKELKMLDDEES